ncbi:MAG: hypothetical protein QE271_14070 [Bacteriovoracaceae bacterium]|nr:hypothetical protein [Bacteriovoracaceae bacterium]
MLTSAPSDMHNFPWQRITEWSTLVLFLLFLFYAAKKILQEKTSFVQDSVLCDWNQLFLQIAKWWTPLIQNKEEMKFYRSDTHYDWEAQFILIKENIHQFSKLEDYFLHWIDDQKLLFDEHESILSIQATDLFQDQALTEHIGEFLRMEGTATKNQIERLYVDIVLLRLKNETKIYRFTSISSVLNGSLEGPFFEETLKLAKWKNE